MKYLLFLVLAVCALAAFAIYRIVPPSVQVPQELAHCERILGNSANVGFDLSGDGSKIEVIFGAKSETEVAIEPATLEAFLVCVDRASSSDPALEVSLPDNIIRFKETARLGDIIYILEEDVVDPISITVLPFNDTRTNSLLVEPFSGRPWEAIRYWCNEGDTASCFECTPSKITDSTPGVTVRIANDAQVTKELIGYGVNPNAGIGGIRISREWEIYGPETEDFRWPVFAYRCLGE